MTVSSPDATTATANPRKVLRLAPEIRSTAGRLRRLVAFDHCRMLLPQFTFLRRRDPLAQLHRLAFSDPAAAARGNATDIFLARMVFAVVAWRQMLLFFTRFGPYVAKHHGIPFGRQLRDLWYCAWRHNQFPRHYYWRKLFLTPDREAWLDNLEHRQVNTLMQHLNCHLPITRATNKFSFFHHCLAHGLPTPEILAAWTDRGHMITAVPIPLAHDLFAKPVTEFGSVGIVVIPFDPIKRTHCFAQCDLAWPDLLAKLAQHAQTTGCSLILQRRLFNAPRNAVYGQSDICNLRILTAHPVSGDPEAIASFIRLPSSRTTTGHDRHILFSNIDLMSGRMTTGRFRDITMGEFPDHPDTGAPIAGRILPGWSEMLALAFRAHRTLPWLPFIGWDIVDTNEGVLLLEANAYWGADGLQPPGVIPLGRTRFPEIYLEWYNRLNQPAGPDLPTPAPQVHEQDLESSRSAANRH